MKILQMQNIFKQFFGVNVLSSVDFDLKGGEAHALLGLNGAGKTTLINLISGVYEPDYGHIWLDGKPVRISSPGQAQRLGIHTVHQSPVLAGNLSVAENLFLGNEPRKLGFFTDFRKMRELTAKVLDQLGNTIDPDSPVSALSMGERYVVAVARCFVIQPRILILDEPTVGLADTERKALFRLIRSLKRRNTGIIYITHKLNELPDICDRMTVLKDGRNVATCAIGDLNPDQLIEKMCGRRMVQYFPEIQPAFGEEVLKIERLNVGNKLKDISFNLRSGEVLGIAGQAGSGKTELAKTIFGHLKRDSGKILWRGQEIHFEHPLQAIDHAFGYISDDRLKAGLFMDMNVTQNLTIATLHKRNVWQLIKLESEKESVLDKVIELDIKIRGLEQEVKYLSGGNQQKILLGRWMMSDSELFILDEPTQGIDVASKSDIYLSIRNLADEGRSVLMVSDDVQELMGLCSRILVMNHGMIVDEMDYREATEERILKAMGRGAASGEAV